MKHNLQNFNQICQNIIIQKRHGRLHEFRPFARKKRYFQQDFLQLWEQSCYKKVKTALQGAGINDLKMTLIDTPQARNQRDIYIGTTRPGVFLRYKIDPQIEKNLIYKLFQSGKQNNKDTDIFALWRIDIQQLIKSGQDFTLNTEFQVIARVQPKSGQNYQDQKTPQVMNFNQQGFKGSLFFWFDFSKFKRQHKESLETQKNQLQRTLDTDMSSIAAQDIQKIQNAIDDHFTYTQSNPEQDKVKIGTFDISIKDSDKSGILDYIKHLGIGDIGQFVSNKAINSFNVLLGNAPGKDSTEKPDIIRKKIGLFGTQKPFAQVTSTVTLQSWMYDMQFDKQQHYMNKPQNKMRQITKLIKFPFRPQNLKKPYMPNPLSDRAEQMSQCICWSVGKYHDVTSWIHKPITKSWLTDTSIPYHWMTFRFNSWVRSHDGRYYFDYRCAVNYDQFYKMKQIIDQINDRINEIDKQLSEIVSISASKADKLRKQKLEKAKQLEKLEEYTGDFNKWLQNFFQQVLHDTKDRLGDNIVISKYLMDSKNQVQNKDTIIHNSLRDCAIRDITAYDFIRKQIIQKNWLVEGQPFTKIMQDLVKS